MSSHHQKEKIDHARIQVLQKTFQQFRDYVRNIVGDKKTAEFALRSHQTIQPYFRNLTTFQVGTDLKLQIQKNALSENEILAFSVWMFQFIKEMKNFMIGIGRVDPRQVTRELNKPLQEMGFYDFYQQASEFDYS